MRNPSWPVILLVASALALGRAAAQCPPVDVPQLVLDINRTTGDSEPELFADLGGLAVFVANDGTTGAELWRTDGSASGTSLVVELEPGPADAGITEIAAAGANAYLLRGNLAGDFELWITDASAAGTRLLATLSPAIDGQPAMLVTVGARAFFVGGAVDLWTSDGTVAGTQRLFDGSRADVWELAMPVAYQGRLFFAAGDATSGVEPWSSDGTIAGTLPFADIAPGAASANPLAFGVAGGRLYVAADDGVTGMELHVTDGVPGVISLVADIEPGFNGSWPSGITDAGGIAVFAARTSVEGSEPWRSDGTPAGTFLLGDLAPNHYSSSPEAFTASGARVLFRTADDTDGDHAWFVTDGSVAGTTFVTALRSCARGRGDRALISPVAGGWIVGDRDLVSGCEPWFLDGTPGSAAGFDVAPGLASSLGAVSEPFASFGARAFLALDAPATGREPHVADASGAAVVADINLGSQDSQAEAFAALGDRAVFLATDGLSGLEPWISDGTPGGTLQLADVVPGAADGVASVMGTSGSLAYFLGRNDPGKLRLWRSDGTPAGTAQVTSRVDAMTWPPTAFRGGVLFAGTEPANGSEIWFSDGTDAGTRLAVDIVRGPGSGAARLQDIVVSGDRAFLVVRTASGLGDDVLVTDGTPGGTELVLEAGADGGLIGEDGVIPWRGGVAVLRTSPTLGLEPWILEGDPIRARRAGDVADPLPRSPNAGTLGLASGLLLFGNAHGTGDVEPWTCDGLGPVRRLADLLTGPESSLPEGALGLGTRLVFSAIVDGFGRELHVTDGTSLPERLTDIAPGDADTTFRYLASNDASALFGAHDPSATAASEAWLTDGTTGGTRPLGILLPRAIRPSAQRAVAAGGRFFFVADDGVFGEEVFVLDPDTDGDGLADSCDPCAVSIGPPGRDTDGDGVEDSCDRCPSQADPSNADLDQDGIGDACDDDADADGWPRTGTPGIDGDCDDLDLDAGVLREVSDLRVSGRDALSMTWRDESAWAGPGVAYDVIDGPLGPGVMGLAPFAGAGCLRPDVPQPAATGVVTAGSRWFLVRAGLPATSCGEGPTGSGPIPDAVACP